MTAHYSRPSPWTLFSPWMVLGSVGILAGILLFLAIKNAHREKEFMEGALLSEAKLLIRSIEAGSRTGMMGMGWGQGQIQLLIEETAQQPEVLYAAIVDSTGKIIAHSTPEMVGETLALSLPQAGETNHSFSAGGRNSFDVVRAYQPWVRQRGGGRGEGRRFSEARNCRRDLFIVVGLDTTPFEDAHLQDVRQTAILFGIMFLVGAAGFLSLGLAQHYRNARRSLQDIQAFTATLVNQMPIGLMAVSLGGQVHRTNEAALRILGTGGPPPEDLAEYPCFLPILQQLEHEETVVEREIRCLANGGRSVPLLVNAAAIRAGTGNTTGYVFLFADITRIKALEEQLRRSERLASLGRMAAGIAHEIRNPLSSIKGFASILAGRHGEDERSLKISQVMIQEVERLNRVISELLDFARPPELHKERYVMHELIKRSLPLVEKEATERNVRIDFNVAPEQLEAEIDPDRFAQLLLNLHLNAIQAMDEGGVMKVEALQDGEETLVRVSDSGSGIRAEHIPHIFDPYFTTKTTGVGLGLANVHKLVEAHEGEIEVESRPGCGTTFTIRIPAVQCT
jgi:two-component system, NtrC family, sensor histidine kinase HydH